MEVVSTGIRIPHKSCHKYMTLTFAGHLHVVTYNIIHSNTFTKHSVFEAYRHHGMYYIVIITRMSWVHGTVVIFKCSHRCLQVL